MWAGFIFSVSDLSGYTRACCRACGLVVWRLLRIDSLYAFAEGPGFNSPLVQPFAFCFD